MPVLVAAVALLGLVVGSFLNVVVYRVPRGESIARPASHCPACGHAVRARHNIPIVSWLLLGGKCADCSSPISPRYPLVEFATGALFAAVTIRLAESNDLGALPAYLFFVAVGIALAAIDIDVMRLPNIIVLPSYAVLAILLMVAALVSGDADPLLRAAAGAAAMFALYFAIALAYPGGIGYGDVKFAGVVGGALGYLSYGVLIVGAFAAFVVGGLVGGVLLTLRRATRKSAMAFGPAMVAGAFVAILAGSQIADTYSSFVRLG